MGFGFDLPPGCRDEDVDVAQGGPWQQGTEDRRAGIGADGNPYVAGSDSAQQWAEGWAHADDELSDREPEEQEDEDE